MAGSKDSIIIDYILNFITKNETKVKKVKKELDEVKKTVENTNKSVKPLNTALDKTGKEAKDTADGLDKAGKSAQNTGSKMSQSKSQVDRLGDSLNKTKKQAEKLGGTHAQPKVSLMDRASSSLTKLSSGLRSFSGKTWRATVKILDYATAPLRTIKNMLFSVKSLVLAIGAGWAANKLIMNPINLADSYSSAQIGFSTLFGEKKGQQMMDKIDQFAKETPFKTSGVITNVQKMMAMGWDPNRIIKDMETIGDAAAATGKGDEGLGSIVYALSEIRSKGKLSTQELNQLASAGIKAKAYLAEGLGYGTSDKGMKKLAEDLEDGAIGANKAVELILKGMEEFDGMMDKTANETVEGLKSQIEDTFEINIFRKWGQGLQDGAKRGLGSIVKLLNTSEKGLENVGEAVYGIGKELSNWAADKLENTIDKIIEITSTSKFKNASLGGKIKILWDEVIAQPFSAWWDTKGEKYISEKMSSMGEGLGTAASTGLLKILGVKDTGILGEAAGIGGSFVDGFLKGFDGDKVADAFTKAIKRGFKALFNGSELSKIILAGLALKVLPPVLSGISSIINLAGTVKGAAITGKGLIGSTGNAMVNGTGILGKMASLGYSLKGGPATAGMYFGNMSTAMSGTAAAAYGGAATLGIAGTVAGLGSATKDFVSAAKSDYESDKKRSNTRGLTKLGMVGAGAAAGAAIGSVIPVVGTGVGALVGAGIGGLTAILSGNKVADSITKIKKSGEELKNINLNKHFGDITLTAKDLQTKIKDVIGTDTIKRVDKYNSAVEALDTSINSINQKKTTLDFISFQTQNGVKMTDSMKSEYISAAESIAEDVQNYISTRNYATNSAVDLLFGGNKAGESLKTGFNKHYGKYTKQINELGQKLNDTLAKAIEDGKLTIDEQKKIDELVDQITSIQTKVEQQLAQKEFEAKIEGLKFDYGVGSGDMSAGSFKALNKGLNEQLSTVVTANKDARDRLLQEIKEKYANTVGGVTAGKGREEYDTVKKQYLETTAELVVNVTDVSLKGLKDAYGKEMNTFQDKLSKSFTFNSTSRNPLSKQFNTMVNSLQSNTTSFIERTYGISESTQKAMKELVKSMEPQKEQLEEIKKGYEQLGLEVPQTIQSALDEINFAEAMSGNVDAMYSVWANEIANSPQKEQIVKAIKSGAVDIPKQLKEAILDACEKEKVTAEVDVEADANVNTDTAANKTKTTIADELGKSQSVDKTTNVTVNSNTNTGPAVTSTNNAIQSAYANPFSTTGKVNLGLTPTTPFSTTASNFRSSFLTTIQNKFSNPFSVTQRVNVSISKNTTGNIVEGSTGIPYSDSYLAKNGYKRDKNGRVVKKANGGFINERVLSWIGEDGPEVVIPLGSNRRKRGIDLWKKAGRMMGIANNAEGGAYGNASSIGRLMESSGIDSNNTVSVPETKHSNSGKGTVNINVGGITIEVDGSSGNLLQSLQEQKDQIGDTLCEILADALEDGFKNIPVAT